MSAEAVHYNMHDAKTHLSRIIERVEHGEEIIIDRAGTPVAKVVPLVRRANRTAVGSLAGQLDLSGDWTRHRPTPRSPPTSASAHDPAAGHPRRALGHHRRRDPRHRVPRPATPRAGHLPLPGHPVGDHHQQSAGKLPGPPDLAERVRDMGFRELPVTHAHAIAAGRLPPHHRDPFDRMLVAQAITESLTLASRDASIALYDVDVLKV